MVLSNSSKQHFRKIVWDYYKHQGRHTLPWRKTRDPYKILVSEVMLQQTQVDRVQPFYKNFLRKFPDVKALARAPLSEVLKAWQGLGYNRRAKMLHEAAKRVVRDYGGKFPKTAAELEALPGVGPYTARAVAAFAYDAHDILIETNIRTAVMHHYFPRKSKVSDAEIEKVLKKAAPIEKAREWNWALMDYGASLKRSGVRTNARVKSYTKQSTFKGSLREARGAILRALAEKPETRVQLQSLLGADRGEQIHTALKNLIREKLIARKKGKYQLAD